MQRIGNWVSPRSGQGYFTKAKISCFCCCRVTKFREWKRTLWDSAMPRAVIQCGERLGITTFGLQRGVQIFQKSRHNFKNLYTRKVTWIKFHTEHRRILGAPDVCTSGANKKQILRCIMHRYITFINPPPARDTTTASPAAIHSLNLLSYPRLVMGTAMAQWLRRCATNRKVASSISDSVIGIFHWHNPSDRTMALGSTQPLTEMSTRRNYLGVNAARCVRLTNLPPHCAVV